MSDGKSPPKICCGNKKLLAVVIFSKHFGQTCYCECLYVFIPLPINSESMKGIIRNFHNNIIQARYDLYKCCRKDVFK
jgi:hypothetical protein